MNTIVAQIHESFDSAELELVQEAEQILNDAENEDKKERTDALRELGFTNADPVRKMSEEEMERAEEILHLKKRYDRIAPQYKFITENKLTSICEKYKIIVGPSQRYTGDIPESNQEDIRNFKILDDSFLAVNEPKYEEARWITAENEKIHPKDMSTSHIINCIRLVARRLRDKSQIGRYMSTSDVKFNKGDVIRAMFTELTLRGDVDGAELRRLKDEILRTPLNQEIACKLVEPFESTYFHVAADVNSFDTEGTKLEGVHLRDDNPDVDLDAEIRKNLFQKYDPIVMARVQGGYLIVTAWGEEASDPDVINPKNN